MFKFKINKKTDRYSLLYQQAIKDNLEIYRYGIDKDDLFYISKIGERNIGLVYTAISLNDCLDVWYSPHNIDDRNYRSHKEREPYLSFY